MVNGRMFQSTTSVIDNELRARRGGVGSADTKSAAGPHDTTIWVTGVGDFLSLGDAADGTPGYRGSSGGSVFGIDHALGTSSRIGLAGAFGSQTFSTPNSASYSGQSAQLIAYASITNGTVFLDGQLGGMFNEGTARRLLSGYGSSARGDVSQTGGGASVRAGTRTEVAGWGLEPSVSLRLLALRQAALSESGADAVAMNVAAQSLTSARTQVAMDVDRRIRLNADYAIVASATVGCAHEMIATNSPVTASFSGLPGSSLTMSDPAAGRTELTLGAYAELKTNSPLSAFIGYDSAVSVRSTSQQVVGGVRYTW
jgi:fibronectin-binding autotransporter adhesin